MLKSRKFLLTWCITMIQDDSWKKKKEWKKKKKSCLKVLPWGEHCISTLIRWFLLFLLVFYAFKGERRVKDACYGCRMDKEALKMTFEGVCTSCQLDTMYRLIQICIGPYRPICQQISHRPLQQPTDKSTTIYIIAYQIYCISAAINLDSNNEPRKSPSNTKGRPKRTWS